MRKQMAAKINMSLEGNHKSARFLAYLPRPSNVVPFW